MLTFFRLACRKGEIVHTRKPRTLKQKHETAPWLTYQEGMPMDWEVEKP